MLDHLEDKISKTNPTEFKKHQNKQPTESEKQLLEQKKNLEKEDIAKKKLENVAKWVSKEAKHNEEPKIEKKDSNVKVPSTKKEEVKSIASVTSTPAPTPTPIPAPAGSQKASDLEYTNEMKRLDDLKDEQFLKNEKKYETMKVE